MIITKYHSSPYRANMPRWVAIIGTTLLLALQYFISGLNEDIAPRLTSYFGLDSSKVSFFLLISTVGLVAILPITYRFRDYFRRVSLLLGVIGLQFFISVLCIFTSNEVLLLITSFLMGGLKIICIIDFLSLSIDLFPFLKNRGLFYGVFYGFVRTMREVSSYFTLTLIDQYDWRVIFIVSAIAAIFSIFICLVLFHRSRMQRKVPLYQVEWISMLLMIVAGVSLCYILTMGKEKEWFASQEIVYASILLIPKSSMGPNF
ncbi:MFS transporter [Arachidicoccus soli]|uniref:MFS transporter n=1 Tax=Arachidicoccus soli TaxID=2341117 RepID=A0A386HNF0_9BACT|nr:MFS transporter [Arachidicoccus soli]AYD47040.1 MFS transporter [Arachidicoccus soli]